MLALSLYLSYARCFPKNCSPKVALEIQFLLSCQMKNLAAQCSYGFAAFSDLSWRIALC